MKRVAPVAIVASLVVIYGAVFLAQSQPGTGARQARATPGTSRAYRVATFDSGFGGYFTAKEIEKQARALAAEGYGPFEIAHYGDTTNVPYGEKRPEEIASYASAGILTAFREGAGDVFIACNTASTQIDRIREILRAANPAYPNHAHSIIDVSVREVMKTVSARLRAQDVVVVGVFATPATVRSENYPRFLAKALNVPFAAGRFTKLTQPRWLASKGPTIDSYAYVTELALGPRKKVVVYQLAPANWVELIENGAPEADKQAAVADDLATLVRQTKPGDRFDVVGEFCTHYPVFDEKIRRELRKLGKVAPDAPFIVQGPLMAQVFRSEVERRKPSKSPAPVPGPGTPPFYMTGTNVDSIRSLIKSIFPNDPEPLIAHKEFSLAPVAAQGGNVQDEIRRVIDGYVAAREAGDAKALGQLFTDDVDQLVSSGEWRRGREEVVRGTLASSQAAAGKRTITAESIRVLAADVAVADGRYEIGAANGAAARHMWTSITLKRSGAGWRIAAIRNMLPAPAAR